MLVPRLTQGHPALVINGRQIYVPVKGCSSVGRSSRSAHSNLLGFGLASVHCVQCVRCASLVDQMES